MAAREVDFDVVVLGAGPAGCAAAILCAQNGLKVTLLEREDFPRHRPGETLHPGVEPLLRQLGLDRALRSAGFLRHPGTWVRWPSQIRFEPFGADDDGQWLGFQAWRASFDALMLERARELGVVIRQPCQAIEPLREETRVSGMLTAAGPLTAQVSIDASGGGHWLARKLALPIKRYSPRLIARFGYVQGDCPVRDDAPALVADETGWTWTARVRPNLYQWTRLSWSVQQQSSLPPDELRNLDPQGPTRATDVTWRMVSVPSGPGYFLVGDAAAVLDPASSHGVLKALMSGMMAAHLSTRLVRNEVTDEESSRIYLQWLGDWFKNDVAQLRELYSQLPNCTWSSQPNSL